MRHGTRRSAASGARPSARRIRASSSRAAALALHDEGHEVHVIAPGGSVFDPPREKGGLVVHRAGGGEVAVEDDGGANWVQRCGDRITDGSVYFDAVSFADQQSGWVAASRTYWSSAGGGAIYHTTNGGVDWVEQFRDSANDYYDVEAVSSTNVWAVGSNVIHTTDGGAHWEEVNIGE